VAGAFVHRRHGRDAGLPRFAGWWGHDKAARFRMEPGFRAIPGAEGWQLSNPPVLGMAALLAALELFMEAGMTRLREKSLALTGFLERRLDDTVAARVEILTPRDPARRGCQLSLRLQDGATAGREVFGRLAAAGVVCDWREPDVIRVAPAPLYNSFADVERFVTHLAEALQ
jgi:kynureninase